MKRKLSILTIMGVIMVYGINHTISAQSTARVGVKGGLSISNLYVDDVNDENARVGFNGGFYGQILSSDVFAIQPEVLFSTKGSENEFGGRLFDQTVRFNLNYIDVPVLAVFKLGESAEIHLGGYGSFLISANTKYEGDIVNGTDELDRDEFKSYDAGLVGGFGLNFGPAQIGTRYNYGLVKIADSSVARTILGDSKNSVAQIYISFNFNQ